MLHHKQRKWYYTHKTGIYRVTSIVKIARSHDCLTFIIEILRWKFQRRIYAALVECEWINLMWLARYLLLAWIRNHMVCKIRDEITYPFQIINGVAVEVWELISNYTLHFTVYVIAHPCWQNRSLFPILLRSQNSYPHNFWHKCLIILMSHSRPVRHLYGATISNTWLLRGKMPADVKLIGSNFHRKLWCFYPGNLFCLLVPLYMFVDIY